VRLLIALASLALLGAAPPAQPQPKASLDDLSWLAGEWTGEGFGLVLHENFSAAVGGQMAAHFYGAKDGKPEFYEFETIAQVGDSLVFRVKHFNPDMTGWEEKDKFVGFPLISHDKDVWRFDGLTIRRTGPDTAEHIVTVKHGDEPAHDVVLRYRRVSR